MNLLGVPPASHRATRQPRAPAARAAPAPSRSPSLTELITLQWKREHGELPLDSFLLAMYFMRLGTLVERAYDRMCREGYGVSGSDMRVLLALRRGGLPYVKRPTDLFRALLVTSGAITKKVDRLATAGYVERLPDPGHHGGFLIHLTRAGLRVAEEAVERLALHSVLAPAMQQFTGAEIRAGATFALRTLSALENQPDEAEPD